MKRLFLLLLFPLGYLINWLAQINQDFTENFFSLGIYKFISHIISFIFSFFPFSVAEILLVFGFLASVFCLIFSIVKSIKEKKFKSFLDFLKNFAVVSSVIYFIFILNCGVNYYRYSFTHYYDDEKTQYSSEQLQELCVYLITEGGEIRENLSNDDFEISPYKMSDMADESFSKLGEKYNVLSPFYSKPKPIFLSSLMSHTKITGVFFPFTIEANVNVDVPSYQIPNTMLHEQAHQCGFMLEDEANFIAWLAGKNSSYDIVRYSSYMSASVYAMNSLYDVDIEAFKEIYSLYTPKQYEDKQASYDYWERFEDKVVGDVFENVNDNYLKANGQEDGIISYGLVTELLLMDYFSTNE